MINAAVYSPTWDMSQPGEMLNQPCPGLHLVQQAPHMLFDSNNAWVVLRLYWRKVVVDRKHDGRCVSLKMLLQCGRTLHQCKSQHDRFAILDGIEVLYDRFGEPFCSDTTEAAQSIVGQRRYKTKKNRIHTGRHMERV